MHQVSELDRVELARRSYPPLAYLPSCSYGTPSAKGFLHYWTRRDGLIRPPVNHVFLLSFPFLSVPIFHFYFSILPFVIIIVIFSVSTPLPHPCCVALRCVSWNSPPRIAALRCAKRSSLGFLLFLQHRQKLNPNSRDPTQPSSVELLPFPPLDI